VSKRSTPQIVASVLLGIGVLVALLLPVPYVVLSPGPVIDVLGDSGGKPLIAVSGAPTYPTTGQLDLTTVNEAGGPHGRIPLTRVFGAWVDPVSVVVPTKLLYPDETTPQQVEQESTEEMLQSQDLAAVAALRHLDMPVTLTVSVGDVRAGSPAQGRLRVGDVFVTVDGTPVHTGAELRAAIRKHVPGQTVRFVVRRAGERVVVPVETEAAGPGSKVAVVGVTPKDGYESPVTVSIRLEDVGGPSAGLMFTLGIIDLLTPAQENGGGHVAGTGTIDADGHVGPIGGIRQKMAGARDSGATVFLVPAGNCAEALMGVPAGLRLVKVTDVDDALSGMAAAVAGRPAPTCAR
jgi:PDZ domain-containing protein